MKRRITLVVDADKWDRLYPNWPESTTELITSWTGGTVESVEDIPDPDRVQEFRVRLVTKATDDPHQAYHVFNRLTEDDLGWSFIPEFVTVTEVDPTEVER